MEHLTDKPEQTFWQLNINLLKNEISVFLTSKNYLHHLCCDILSNIYFECKWKVLKV